MQALQRLAPQIKELQAKYKDDKQRLKQETMKFYQEHKVNPFASCLPLVAQLPVFLSLFYMLRKDLRIDICPGHIDAVARSAADARAIACDQVDPGARIPVHPRPHRQGHGRRAGRAARAVRRLAAALQRC